MDLKKDFSLTECKIMIDILRVSKRINDPTVSKIAETIGVSVHSGKFYNVIKYLNEVEVIEMINKIGVVKILKINQKRLKNLIDEQELVTYFYKYFNDYHYCTW